MIKNELSCGISCYSSYIKLAVFYGEKRLSFSKKILNFDDVMIPQLKRLITKLGLDMKDIKNLCVVCGPGRFTAIRSVYTFASVYKILSGCKVWGVDVFGLLAYNIFKNDKEDKDIAVVSHAFRDEYYLAFYRIRKGKLFEFKKPLWICFNELLKKLENFKGTIIYDKEEFDIDFSSLNNKYISFPNENFMKVIPYNIIESAIYFGSSRFEPIYLKPAKFEKND